MAVVVERSDRPSVRLCSLIYVAGPSRSWEAPVLAFPQWRCSGLAGAEVDRHVDERGHVGADGDGVVAVKGVDLEVIEQRSLPVIWVSA